MARVAKRTRRRMACRLVLGHQRFSGLVLDLSSSGIFVQTTAKPRPRDPVTIELNVPGQREPIRLEAHVARLFLVPAQLATVAQGGVGLRIGNAPEAYFQLLQQLQLEGQRGSSAPLESGEGLDVPGEPHRRYRVRMTQLGRARTRTLDVVARSSEEAAELARAETGDGWKVLEATEQK